MANGGIIGTVNNPTSSTATGVWQQEEQYEAVRDGTWPSRPLFTTKSLRFNRGSSDFLRRTMSTAGTSDKVGTYSGWVKRSTVSLDGMFFEGKDLAANNYTQIYFLATGKLTIYGSTGPMDIVTTALFRDPSAWYHVVVAFDTTQGTASNRVKIYVNGTQFTSVTNGNGDAAQYPSQNSTIYFGVNGDQQGIGIREDGALLWNGYMSEIIYVDGQALAPTSFGVANSSGFWTPIIYAGTYGNNGFNLQFENAAALGTDSSPNGNTFTVSNLTSIDQTTDYPKNNYATLNILDTFYTSSTISEGALTLVGGGTNANMNATIGLASGKWYWETKVSDWQGSNNSAIGISSESPTATNYEFYNQSGNNTGYGYYSNGSVYGNGGTPASGYGSASGTHYISVALDLDNNKIAWGYDGTFQGSANPATGANMIAIAAPSTLATGLYFPAFTNKSGTKTLNVNFGNPTYALSSAVADGNGYGNFEYAVPSGFYAINTANLAEFG